MSQTIDIKTKKIIPQQEHKFDKTLVLEHLERNLLSHWDTWGKFQQAWTSRAYKSFRDLDKYIVLIYLIRESWQKLADRFQYQSMDEFYESDFVIIEKINLIQISNDLNIPKEITLNKGSNFITGNFSSELNQLNIMIRAIDKSNIRLLGIKVNKN